MKKNELKKIIKDCIIESIKDQDNQEDHGYITVPKGIPQEVIKHVQTFMNSGKYEYADNMRIAKAGDAAQVGEYMKIYNDGCCGYYDGVTIYNGVPYLFGFNYGH